MVIYLLVNDLSFLMKELNGNILPLRKFTLPPTDITIEHAGEGGVSAKELWKFIGGRQPYLANESYIIDEQ